MTIFFYKRLIINPEIGNTHVWVLPNIWILGRVRDTKVGTSVSNEMLLNATKCQGYSFYCFWDNKVKPTGWEVRGGGGITPTPLQTHTHTQTHTQIIYIRYLIVKNFDKNWRNFCHATKILTDEIFASKVLEEITS